MPTSYAKVLDDVTDLDLDKFLGDGTLNGVQELKALIDRLTPEMVEAVRQISLEIQPITSRERACAISAAGLLTQLLRGPSNG